MIDKKTIEGALEAISATAIRTPILALDSDRWRGILPEVASAHMKLELFQQAGSFKARGAWIGIQRLSSDEREAGVCAASGGNHAMAVAWAAQAAGVSSKIAIPKAADPLRIDACRASGAEVILCDDIRHAFATMEEIVALEGRVMMHPFEGEHMSLGSATCGAEFVEQCPGTEVFIVPIGGGGLISGMAAAIKLMNPGAVIYGVEPRGADSMRRSLAAGLPVTLEKIDTIADSLASPLAMPLSFGLAQYHIDEVVLVEDDALLQGMRYFQDILRIVAEPACAASLAALIGPLAERVRGKSVGIIACGSNISLARYTQLLEKNT